MRAVGHDQRRATPGVSGDHRSVLQDLHPAGEAAHLHRLAGEAERHAVLAPLRATKQSAPTVRRTTLSNGSGSVSGSGVSNRRSVSHASATRVLVAGQPKRSARAASRTSVQTCSASRLSNTSP